MTKQVVTSTSSGRDVSLNVSCPVCSAVFDAPCNTDVPGALMYGQYGQHVERWRLLVETVDAESAKRRGVKDIAAAAIKRSPVDYRYDAVHPEFLKFLAKIGAYADKKYDSWDQYLASRLEGDKAPLNHVYEHLRQYVMGEPHDHFGSDLRWHLAAVAYNAMMEFYYHTRFGWRPHPSAPAEDEYKKNARVISDPIDETPK